jgi:hypothetical protein
MVVTAALTACDQPEVAGVKVVDSGVFGFHQEKTFWVDDHRVIFVGWIGSKAEAYGKDSDFPKKHLLLWNVVKNEVSVYRENAWDICYFDGFVSYWTGDRSIKAVAQRERMTGQFGEESVTHRKPITRENKWFRRKSEIDCRIWDAPEFLGRSDWTPLAKADGLIDRGPWPVTTNDHPGVYLVSVDGTERHRLRMKANEVGRVAYYSFKTAYLIQPLAAGFSTKEIEANCWRYWWVTVNGQTSAHCLPNGPWAERASMWVVGSAMGPIVISHNTGGAGRVGDAGAYLVDDDGYAKLISGPVWSPSVSKDGCKLAFLHAPYPMASDVSTEYWISMKMIDLC